MPVFKKKISDRGIEKRSGHEKSRKTKTGKRPGRAGAAPREREVLEGDGKCGRADRVRGDRSGQALRSTPLRSASCCLVFF